MFCPFRVCFAAAPARVRTVARPPCVLPFWRFAPQETVGRMPGARGMTRTRSAGHAGLTAQGTRGENGRGAAKGSGPGARGVTRTRGLPDPRRKGTPRFLPSGMPPGGRAPLKLAVGTVDLMGKVFGQSSAGTVGYHRLPSRRRSEPPSSWGGIKQIWPTRAYAQQLVTTRLLDCLHDPVGRPSRLQGIHPGAQ